MIREYEIYSGRRIVSTEYSISASLVVSVLVATGALG